MADNSQKIRALEAKIKETEWQSTAMNDINEAKRHLAEVEEKKRKAQDDLRKLKDELRREQQNTSRAA